MQILCSSRKLASFVRHVCHQHTNIINFNTIDTQQTSRVDKCSTNTVICQDSCHSQHYTNIMQEAKKAEKCCVNTNTISKFKSKDKSTVIDNEPNRINYLLPHPRQDKDKKVSAEIMHQLRRDFNHSKRN